MSAAGSTFDQMNRDEKLSLLVALGFDEPQRYREWDEKDLKYGCLFFEVQDELDRCFVKGQWLAAPLIERPIHTRTSRKIKRSPRRKVF